MEEFFNAISNFGFPIVVAGYLLFRFEKILLDLKKVVDEDVRANQEQIKAINELKKTVDLNTQAINNRKG